MHRGEATTLTYDYARHALVVSFAMRGDNQALEEELTALLGKDLDIDWKPHQENRGLNANSYFHLLCREIGKHKDIKRSELWVKNKLIASDGQPELLPSGEQWVIKTNVDLDGMWNQDTLRVRPMGVKTENGKEVFFYGLMRHSHTYTVSEMSQLIEATVEEAKRLGIDTMPRTEVERLLKMWRPKKE